jgi:P pilus assembly chaperone PapD
MALLSAPAISLGQRPGDLIISPTRVLLDERGKSSDLTLLNRGMKPVRYRLSLVDMEMSEDGKLRRTDTESPVSALNVLRLSPREIVLAPGVSQRIRIAAFMPANQADGELRSHLVFEPITVSAPQSQTTDSDGQLRLSLDFRSVISIPVIVRHGRLGASATLEEGSVARDTAGWFAKVTVHRFGNRSLRGNLTATFVSADKAHRTDLGLIAGLAVYCPNADRVVQVRLDKDLSTLGRGTVEIEFAEPDRSRGAADAKTEISVPG